MDQVRACPSFGCKLCHKRCYFCWQHEWHCHYGRHIVPPLWASSPELYQDSINTLLMKALLAIQMFVGERGLISNIGSNVIGMHAARTYGFSRQHVWSFVTAVMERLVLLMLLPFAAAATEMPVLGIHVSICRGELFLWYWPHVYLQYYCKISVWTLCLHAFPISVLVWQHADLM